jgi:hypothetical protein
VPPARPGRAGRPEQELVNLGDYPVEAHLPDQVVMLLPGESVRITHIGGQVAELARRGLVELRPVPPEPQPAVRRRAARRGQPAKHTRSAERATQVNGAPAHDARPANPARRQSTTSEKQADRPVGRTGQTRGGA